MELLRFDGLYVGRSGEVLGVLRFFADGTVVSAGLAAADEPGLCDQVAGWLRRENPIVSSGTYVTDGTSLRFFVTIPGYLGGTVDYSGSIEAGELALAIYSHVTQWRGDCRYRFEEVLRERLEAPYTPPVEEKIDVERW